MDVARIRGYHVDVHTFAGALMSHLLMSRSQDRLGWWPRALAALASGDRPKMFEDGLPSDALMKDLGARLQKFLDSPSEPLTVTSEEADALVAWARGIPGWAPEKGAKKPIKFERIPDGQGTGFNARFSVALWCSKADRQAIEGAAERCGESVGGMLLNAGLAEAAKRGVITELPARDALRKALSVLKANADELTACSRLPQAEITANTAILVESALANAFGPHKPDEDKGDPTTDEEGLPPEVDDVPPTRRSGALAG